MLHSQILCQNSPVLQSHRFGIFTYLLRDSRICEICWVKKSQPKISWKKSPFFDVVKRPTFPQPPGKVDVLQCLFYFGTYRYLEIWQLLSIVPYCRYTNRKGDSLFLPFCTIRISMYQKSTLPYIIPYDTYLPQAYSPLEHSGLSGCLFHHPLFPKLFFCTHRRNSTRPAELWGG